MAVKLVEGAAVITNGIAQRKTGILRYSQDDVVGNEWYIAWDDGSFFALLNGELPDYISLVHQ